MQFKAVSLRILKVVHEQESKDRPWDTTTFNATPACVRKAVSCTGCSFDSSAGLFGRLGGFAWPESVCNYRIIYPNALVCLIAVTPDYILRAL